MNLKNLTMCDDGDDYSPFTDASGNDDWSSPMGLANMPMWPRINATIEAKRMPRGFKSDGSHAGDSPKADRIKYAFKLEREIYAWIVENVELGSYSDFINNAIIDAIRKRDRTP